MQQLMPLLLDWLSRSPDPDAGLLGLRRLAAGRARSTQLAVAFRDSPDVARLLCCLLGTSRLLSDRLLHHPDFLADLAAAEPRPLGGDDLEAAMHRAMELRAELEDQRQAVLRTAEREGLRVGAEDVLGRLAVDEVGTALTELAESVLACVIPALDPGLPFAVIAVGRFGGRQLSYASDLDLVFVYDGTSVADTEEADRLATGLQRFLVGSGGPVIYPVDLDLRPEGRNGPLARTLDGYRAYFERWAQAWERHAMVRARPVAGDAELGAAFMSTIEEFVWAGLSEDDRRELRRMKARIERERIPPSEDPAFHLKLGRGSLADVEFCAQTLQLAHGVRETGTTAALERLAAEGQLAADDARVLTESYRFCERTRNRLFLVQGAAGDSLPRSPEQLTRLARSLGMSPTHLRETYRRHTRRARGVVERLFYGRG
jgi:glutamate-ammonia-ligase adenylyltransferase